MKRRLAEPTLGCHHAIVMRLLTLFVGVPLVELYLLTRVGSQIGFFATLALIFVTGILGANLAKTQGLGVMRRIQADLQAGRIPAAALVDGLIILIAGAVLITPGILTDAFGFLCLVPSFRGLIRDRISQFLQSQMQGGNIQYFHGHPGAASGFDPRKKSPFETFQQGPSGPVIDVEVSDNEATPQSSQELPGEIIDVEVTSKDPK